MKALTLPTQENSARTCRLLSQPGKPRAGTFLLMNCSKCSRPETEKFPFVSLTKRRKLLGFVNDALAPICCSCYGKFNPKRFYHKTDAILRSQMGEAVRILSEGTSSSSVFEAEDSLRAELLRTENEIADLLGKLNNASKNRNAMFLKLRHIEMAHAEILAKEYSARRKEANYVISDRELRLIVFSRDGFSCKHCATRESLSVDHVIPVVRGGGNELENLQTLCIKCNSSKGKGDRSSVARKSTEALP
jgi:hypothetical protein